MKHPFVKLAGLLSLAATLIIQTGCKEDTIIKANLTPTVDNIFTEAIDDTFTVWTKTVFDDSVVTSSFLADNNNNIRAIKGLGTVNDPFFGKTNASLYFQVFPEKANFLFSANPFTLDSAYLILPYTGFSWGDTSASAPKQGFSVYRVLDDLKKDETYYSFTNKNIDRANPVGEAVFVNPHDVKDSVTVLGAKRFPHLRIKLKPEFVEALRSTAANSSDNAAFISAIKGLCVAPVDTNNANARTLLYFNIQGTNNYSRASVQFFYHEGSNTDSVKTAFFNFVSTDAAHYNRITRNYAGYPAAAYINSPSLTDSIILLQNEPGAAIDLRFPYLKNLPSVVINKAQITITKVIFGNDPHELFWAPQIIYPVGIQPDGRPYTVLDREPIDDIGPLNFIDGTRKDMILGSITVQQYQLNLPREFQRAITNKTDELHLRINGTQTFPGAYRLTAAGRTHSTFKVSLKVTYSKLQ